VSVGGLSGTGIDCAAARRFEEEYDVASIRDQEVPPFQVLAIAKNANAFLTSDLPRAIASCRLLASGNQPEITPLLQELYFDIPEWGPRLRLGHRRRRCLTSCASAAGHAEAAADLTSKILRGG
jgi:hypothetical protein